MTRIVFLGTPDAAVATLEGLNERFDIGLVVSQPDRPRGRSSRPQPSPVTTRAEQLGLSVAKPQTATDLHAVLDDVGPFDVGVVVAYGRVLSEEVLELPKHGLLNLHFSLLPRWRGAAPVARALMAGDTMTGVTIIKIDEGLDTGAVLTAQAVDVGPHENAGLLSERLSRIGASLLVNSLQAYLTGEVQPVPQSADGLSYASKLIPSDRSLSSSDTVAEFVNHVRGLAPAPGATMAIDGETMKILAAESSHSHVAPDAWESIAGALVLGVKDGSVEIKELQPPGKKPMSGAAWLRGRTGSRGSIA